MTLHTVKSIISFEYNSDVNMYELMPLAVLTVAVRHRRM
jgi:hypothetical protein